MFRLFRFLALRCENGHAWSAIGKRLDGGCLEFLHADQAECRKCGEPALSPAPTLWEKVEAYEETILDMD